ncbi:Arc family DNA-binding protein [Pseudomonas helleri]|uniref:Arc family DNA-binding protein n=1 Tax=Pseudomonas helleri TaxID=1608996 RepID=A0A7X1Y8C4_9PSED|nr:Arc family DNA-binding protein [Pseudomonas helleri]MQT96942.1 Arc family DNA-binding protein [Pseudomonas helleri]MQU32172.1 Arc family DNA-binding protein [Pseudomonas helleri]
MSEKKQQTAYPLRMPSELRTKIEDLAHENKRSLNAEIIARLEESLNPRHIGSLGMSDLTDALIALGRERGVAVEVSFGHISDGDGDTLSPPSRVTTSVDKRTLLPNSGEPYTYSEQAIIDAMLRALRDIPPDAAKSEPNTGPKPRKKFP